MRRLQRAASPRHPPGADPRALAEGAGPLGRTRLGLLRGRAGPEDRAAGPRDPGAGHLLRDAADGRRAWGEGRAGARRRVRPHPAHPSRRWRPPAGGPAARAAVLDEPPRHRLRAAAGLRRPRLQPRVAGRRLRVRRPGPVRHPVPPRGRAHAARHRGADPLPARDRRLRRALVPGLGDRRAGRGDPRPGRRGPRDLRALGRRRLGDRGRCWSIARSATASPAFSSTTG